MESSTLPTHGWREGNLNLKFLQESGRNVTEKISVSRSLNWTGLMNSPPLRVDHSHPVLIAQRFAKSVENFQGGVIDENLHSQLIVGRS